jgi:hypothetical protein
MSGIFWALQIPKVLERNEFGELIFNENGVPIERQQYFRSKDNKLVPVPGDGFIVRSQGSADTAITKDDLGKEYKRFRFGGGLGYPAGKSTRWRRYMRR